MKTYRLGEMFSGPGGIALGAHEASKKSSGSRILHSWALDYHPETTRTYAANIKNPDGSAPDVRTADVRQFDLTTVPEHDAFAFGFPCNDFSSVGKRKGLDGDFGALYTYGVQALALHEPEWFLAENVSGLSRANSGTAFGKILWALKNPVAAAKTETAFVEAYADRIDGLNDSLEYELVSHLYKFEQYGVPQARHRILVVGIRKDLLPAGKPGFKVPAPTTPNLPQQTTAREAIECPEINPEAFNHELPKHQPQVIERLKLIQPGKNAFNTEYGSDGQQWKLNVKGATLSNIYRRLDPKRPAYTVTGSGGGGTHMYHWEEHRALTNRERARLQTFPDDFEFMGGRTAVRRQIGMAVPPVGAEAIITAILKTLDGELYDVLPAGPSINSAALIREYEIAQKDATQQLFS